MSIQLYKPDVHLANIMKILDGSFSLPLLNELVQKQLTLTPPILHFFLITLTSLINIHNTEKGYHQYQYHHTITIYH